MCAAGAKKGKSLIDSGRAARDDAAAARAAGGDPREARGALARRAPDGDPALRDGVRPDVRADPAGPPTQGHILEKIGGRSLVYKNALS